MSKRSNHKTNQKKSNGKQGITAADREVGKTRLMIIFAMIVIGLAVAVYTIH